MLLKALEKENININTMNDNNIIEKVNDILDTNKYIENNIRKYNFINDKIEEYKVQQKDSNSDDDNNINNETTESVENNHNNDINLIDNNKILNEDISYQKKDNYISNDKTSFEIKNNKDSMVNENSIPLEANNCNKIVEENISWKNENSCNNSIDDTLNGTKEISPKDFNDSKENINNSNNDVEVIKNRLLEGTNGVNNSSQLSNINENSNENINENHIIDQNDKNRGEKNKFNVEIQENEKIDEKNNENNYEYGENEIEKNHEQNLSNNNCMKQDSKNVNCIISYSTFIKNIEKSKNNSKNKEILKNIIKMRNNSESEVNSILCNLNEDEIYEKEEEENEVLEIIEVESESNRDENNIYSNEYDNNLANFIKENNGSKILKNKKMKAQKEFLENQYIILKILEKQYRRNSTINLIQDTKFLSDINYLNISNAELPQVNIIYFINSYI